MACPFYKEEDPLDYTDPSDATATSAWRNGSARNIKKNQLCKHPDEHRAWTIDPATLVEVNAKRRIETPKLPVLSFYTIVQHEGDFVVTTRHVAHAVVSIGQSYGVAHNFLEPRHLVNLYEVDGAGKISCKCPDGETFQGVKVNLDLRPKWDDDEEE